MIAYTYTYDVVTEASAECGDVAERGLYRIGGWQVPLPGDCFGDAAVKFFETHGEVYFSTPDDYDGDETDHLAARALAEALAYDGYEVEDTDPGEHSCAVWRGEPWDAETESGEVGQETRYCHFDSGDRAEWAFALQLLAGKVK